MSEVTVASIRALDAEHWLRTHDVPDYVLEYIEALKNWDSRRAIFSGTSDEGLTTSPLRHSQ